MNTTANHLTRVPHSPASELEGEINLQMDKLHSLNKLLLELELSGHSPSPAVRSCYLMVMDDQIEALEEVLGRLWE